MALNVTRWAREQTAGGLAPKAALMALAERADQRGYCHPSLATLAADMECGRATAKRAVHCLVEHGLVELVIRYEGTRAGERRQTSNRYRLLVTQGQSDPGSERPPGQSDPPPGSERPAPQGQSDPPGTSHSEPVIEPSSRVGGDSKSAGTPGGGDERVGQVLVELVDRIMAEVTPRNPRAYRRAVERDVHERHHAEVVSLSSENPTWTAAEFVDAVLGSAHRASAAAAGCPRCEGHGVYDTGAGYKTCDHQVAA